MNEYRRAEMESLAGGQYAGTIAVKEKVICSLRYAWLNTEFDDRKLNAAR